MEMGVTSPKKLPARQDEALDVVCDATRSFGRSGGTIAEITRAVGGYDRADRDIKGPTTLYGKVRLVLLELKELGRVEQYGRQWVVAANKKRKAS